MWERVSSDIKKIIKIWLENKKKTLKKIVGGWIKKCKKIKIKIFVVKINLYIKV